MTFYRGERHHKAKLKDEDIPLIRRLVAERRWHLAKARELTDAKIGEKFDVTGKAIGRIVYEKNWKHVNGIGPDRS